MLQHIFGRGEVKFRLQDFNSVIEDFSKAIELNPAIASTYFTRAIAESVLGDHNGAITDFKKSIELNPINEFKTSILVLQKVN